MQTTLACRWLAFVLWLSESSQATLVFTVKPGAPRGRRVLSDTLQCCERAEEFVGRTRASHCSFTAFKYGLGLVTQHLQVSAPSTLKSELDADLEKLCGDLELCINAGRGIVLYLFLINSHSGKHSK